MCVKRLLTTPNIELPRWYKNGTRVGDIYSRSGDVEILSNWEYEDDPEDWTSLDWRECDIPVSAFDLDLSSLDKYLLALPNGGYLNGEYQRIAEINKWIVARGSIETALKESPIIVRVGTNKVQIEDGYHRLAVTAILFRMATIKGLCAYW